MANRFEFKRGSLGEIIRSEAMGNVVGGVAEKMATSARGRTDDEIVVQIAGKSRKRAYVRRLGSGAAGEAKDRALGGSVDAGRS